MRRGYNTDIRTEAVTKRYQGKEWLEIQEAIVQKFGVKPSIRQMQHWFEAYKGTEEDPTGAKYIARAIEDSANLAKPLAQAKMMTEVMPVWQKLLAEKDISPADAGWVAFLYYLERQIGREKFDQINRLFRKFRDRLK